MDSVHFHLAFSHAPLFAVAFGAAALLVAVFWQTSVMTRVGLGLLVIGAVLALPVFATGEGAEEMAEGLAGVSEAAIERHESVAGITTALLGGVGLLSLVLLVGFGRREIPRWLPVAGLVLALGATAMVGYTASLGGQIRHSEIAGGPGSTQQQAEIAGPEDSSSDRVRRDRDDDDDD